MSIVGLSIIISASGLLAFLLLVVMSMKLTIAVAGIAGLFVLLGHFLVTDRQRYWTIVFFMALPFAAPKVLGDREAMESIMATFGIPTGSPPAARIFVADILLFAIFLMWITRYVFHKPSVFLPKPALILVAFIFWALVSMSNSINYAYSGFELIRQVKFLLMFILMANVIKSKCDIKTVLVCLAIGVFLQGAICMLQYKFQTSLTITGYDYYKSISKDIPQVGTVGYGGESDKLRASGTVGPHNLEAMYFELMLPLVVAMFFLFPSHLARYSLLGAFASGALGLYLTYSRGGLVGTLIGLTAVVVLMTWKKLVRRELIVGATLIVAIAAFAVFPKAVDYMKHRSGAFKGRWDMSMVGLKMVKVHPIIGFGLNTSVIHLPDFDDENVTIGYPVHNHYLIIASEVGLVGLGLWLFFYFTIARQALAVIRSSDRELALVACGLLAGMCGIAVHMGWDHFGDEVIQTILFIFSAMIVSMKRLVDKRALIEGFGCNLETSR